jgi:integrase
MAQSKVSQAKVIPFHPGKKRKGKPRKSGLNYNRKGSVRKINGKVYMDFIYLNERVRESSGLPWSEQNAREVRNQLDRIIVAIDAGTFRFHEVFPHSSKRNHFTDKESRIYGIRKSPDQVRFGEYAWTWYGLLKDSGRVAERTLFGYKGYLTRYLIPFFGDYSFVELNTALFDRFISWARKQKFRGKDVGNKSINKYFVPLKMICKSAAIEHGWGSTYNPFFGFKKLPEDDPYEKIFPFSLTEQKKLIAHIPDHWKPYFLFAFCSGLRQGEQIGLKPGDIDWHKGLLHVRQAITLNEEGKRIEGTTKNRYSRRTIRLTPVMLEVLERQKAIHDTCGGEYFFSSPNGKPIHPSNLRRRVWIPALEKAGIAFREMKQTRHTFATMTLSCGENPLWIAKVMGHRDTDMIIKVYSKFVEDFTGSEDGASFDAVYQGSKGRKKEKWMTRNLWQNFGKNSHKRKKRS